MLLGTPAAPAGAPAGTTAAQPGTDIQAQWAEYYRSLGYGGYYGQQGQQQPGVPAQATGQPPASTNEDQKVL